MSSQQGRGGMGSHKHGISGRSGPPNAVKRSVAEFFNKEDQRRRKRKGRMFSSLRDLFESLRSR